MVQIKTTHNISKKRKNHLAKVCDSDVYNQEGGSIEINLYAVIAMIWACPKTMSAGGVKFAATINFWGVFTSDKFYDELLRQLSNVVKL